MKLWYKSGLLESKIPVETTSASGEVSGGEVTSENRTDCKPRANNSLFGAEKGVPQRGC
jgi:hypothetical protein